MANQGHAEQEGFETEFLEPPLIAEPSGPQPEFLEAPGIAIDERTHAEFLCEPAQLAEGSGALVQVDKMDFDASLGEEPQRRTRIGALADAEDLHVHRELIGERSDFDRTKEVSGTKLSFGTAGGVVPNVGGGTPLQRAQAGESTVATAVDVDDELGLVLPHDCRRPGTHFPVGP